jgi:hypothetical protein
MVLGVYDLIKKGFFPKGSKILLIHTGGLQGVNGFEERFGFKMYSHPSLPSGKGLIRLIIVSL